MATPAINPTGSNFMPLTGASTGSPVATGGPGNYNFGNATNPNPAGTGMTPGSPMPGASTGAPTAFPGQATPGIGLDPTQTSNLQKTLAGTYHTGLGGYYGSLLQSQGGYNSALTQQNVQDTIAAMQTNINRGSGTLNTQLAQQGISPNSSVSALENAFYQSEATTQENAIVAQDYFNMWNQSMGREFQFAESLGGPTAQEKAGEGTLAKLGAIGGFIGDIMGNSGVQATFSL